MRLYRQWHRERGDMGECPPLGDDKNFNPINQPAICFVIGPNIGPVSDSDG